MVLSQVLQKLLPEKHIYTSPKNYNSELGLAFSLFSIESYEPSFKNLLALTGKISLKALFWAKKYDIFILEYGIDHPGDMDVLLRYITPDYAIFTKLDFTHSDNFPWGKSQVGEEKWKLMQSAKKVVFYNGEDDFLKIKVQDFLWEKYSFFSGDIEVDANGIEKQGEQILSVFTYKNARISTNLLGYENGVYIALGIFLAEKISGEALHYNAYDFCDMRVQEGRFTLFSEGNNILIDSTYNAAPESMKIIIENTKILRKTAFPKYKLGFVLGDMREIGEARESAHRKLARDIWEAEFVFTVWPNTQEFLVEELQKQNFSGEIFSSLSSREVGKHLKKYLEKNTNKKYIILFKGSQNTIFVEEALVENLSPENRKKLPRQSESWRRKKEDFSI